MGTLLYYCSPTTFCEISGLSQQSGRVFFVFARLLTVLIINEEQANFQEDCSEQTEILVEAFPVFLYRRRTVQLEKKLEYKIRLNGVCC